MDNLLVSPEWKALDLDSMTGVVLVIGATDSGKSTFSGYLYNHLIRNGKRAAFIDGDPGQTTFGPPGTITLVFGGELPREGIAGLSNLNIRRSFVGSTTPRGHMIPMLIGAERLRAAAQQEGVEVIIYDTCGLVDPEQGGLSLKHGLVDLLRPEMIIAIQEKGELDLILQPLKRSKRTKVLQIKPSPETRRRSQDIRRSHRREQFEFYFREGKIIEIQSGRYPVFPFPRYILNCLISFEDRNGFTIALGIIRAIDRHSHRISIFSPITDLTNVDAIRLGDLTVDPVTYQDSLLR